MLSFFPYLATVEINIIFRAILVIMSEYITFTKKNSEAVEE